MLGRCSASLVHYIWCLPLLVFPAGPPVPHHPAPHRPAGLAAWEAQRRQWLRKRRRDGGGEGSSEGSGAAAPPPPAPRRAIPAGASYEELLGSGRPFDRPVPLDEMVSFLVACWEDSIGL